MHKRPDLNKDMSEETFRSYYYLKEELVNFCKENNLPISGGKIELTDRIGYFLKYGKVIPHITRKHDHPNYDNINEHTLIEPNIRFSEKHRQFFKEKIGEKFAFNVLFQKWLKTNSGKTYGEAINAYYVLLEEKKKNKTTIDKQFEYNTYIRDFFECNKGKNLNDAIKCWKYKKSLPGSNKYDDSDLCVISCEDK